MLRVKSFKIGDDEGINKLLSTYRLSEGAHILVSEGQVCIPYDDGQPMNATQRVAWLSEMRNRKQQELMLLDISNNVVKERIARDLDRLNELKADFAEADGKPNSAGKTKIIDDLKKNIGAVENRIHTDEMAVLMNNHERANIVANISEFERLIAGIEVK